LILIEISHRKRHSEVIVRTLITEGIKPTYDTSVEQATDVIIYASYVWHYNAAQ